MKRVLLGLLPAFAVIFGVAYFQGSVSAEENRLWGAGYSAEVVEETRKFYYGHPCEEKLLQWVKRSAVFGSKTYTYYYDTHSSPRCGVYTDFGFTDGSAYVFGSADNKAHVIQGKPTDYRYYPNNIMIHQKKTGWDSPYVELAYYSDNVYADVGDVFVNGNGALSKNTTEISSPSYKLVFADDTPLTTRAYGVSENGRFIVFAERYKGVFIHDTVSKTYTTVSLNTAGNGVGNIAVSNDGKSVVHYDSNMIRAGISGQKQALLLYDATSCTQSVGAEAFVSSLEWSSDGCKEFELGGEAQEVLGLDTKISSIESSYIHPRNAYAQAMFIVQESGSSSKLKKTVRFIPVNAPTSQGYLAMGDSYSSGEGDLQGGEWYEPGTDEHGDKDTFLGRNLCHVSRRSYPYLLAKRLGFLPGGDGVPVSPSSDGDFHSVACSGAVIHNVVGGSLYGEDQGEGGVNDFAYRDNQYRFDSLTSSIWQQGVTSQIKSLNGISFADNRSRDFNPEVITLGIVGNDAGFGNKILACALPGTCPYAVAGSNSTKNVAYEIANLKFRLVDTYQKVKREAPENARIYVHGYPVFIDASGSHPCGLNTPFDAQEVIFIAESIAYMNAVVESAAREAGVFYVDVSNTLQGYELCSGVNEENSMMNGATAGDDISNFLLDKLTLCGYRNGCLGSESFHPTPRGHAQYASAIQAQTANFSAEMPEPLAGLIPLPSEFFGSEASVGISQMNVNRIASEPLSFPLSYSDRTSLHKTERESTLSVFSTGFAPNSLVTVEVHSDPVSLGTFTTDEHGNLEGEITLPEDLESGHHEIHVVGVDPYGQEIDAYSSFFVALAEGDMDGDGVLDELDSCPVIVNTGIDVDLDGIDDACDGDTTAGSAQEESEGEVLGDNTGFVKGQPSEETVAGTEEELAEGLEVVEGEVLGASTNTEPNELSQTGQSVVVGTIAGIGIIISVMIVLRKPKIYHAKNN